MKQGMKEGMKEGVKEGVKEWVKEWVKEGSSKREGAARERFVKLRALKRRGRVKFAERSSTRPLQCVCVCVEQHEAAQARVLHGRASTWPVQGRWRCCARAGHVLRGRAAPPHHRVPCTGRATLHSTSLHSTHRHLPCSGPAAEPLHTVPAASSAGPGSG
jgi:hypothetical protein